MPHPYESQPDKAFWREAVGRRDPLEITDLWAPKFAIGRGDPVATLGSCFAQHISRALQEAGYTWLNSEPAPEGFPAALKPAYQYDVFSARLGNVYTTSQLAQWTAWAFGIRRPPPLVWQDGGRWYDPFRPNIQPDGFDSEEEVLATRQHTLDALKRMFLRCRVFVFTLGLTEAWRQEALGVVYPMCPGTIAGEFDPALDRFHNGSFEEIKRDLTWVLNLVARVNPGVRFLLTVSPVPLTATATDQHVLVATTASKSVLRAVAGAVAGARADTDYFPSYEIISSFPFKAMFYEPNLRNVTRAGVDFVMASFLRAMGAAAAPPPAPTRAATEPPPLESVQDEVCEEMMLARAGGGGA
jgi:hypothetical protein